MTVPAGTKLAALADLVRQIVGKVRTVCGKGPDSAGNIALTAADVGAATSSHKHSAADITSGALPVTRGGGDKRQHGTAKPWRRVDRDHNARLFSGQLDSF